MARRKRDKCWHDMPMVAQYVSGGMIRWWWHEVPTGGGTSERQRTSEEKNQNWKSIGALC